MQTFACFQNMPFRYKCFPKAQTLQLYENQAPLLPVEPLESSTYIACRTKVLKLIVLPVSHADSVVISHAAAPYPSLTDPSDITILGSRAIAINRANCHVSLF